MKLRERGVVRNLDSWAEKRSWGEIEGLLGILCFEQEGTVVLWYVPHECAAEEDGVDERLN